MRISSLALNEGLIAIKGATDASLRLGGGVTSFAKLIGYAVSTVSKWASINRVMDGDREVLEYGDYVIPVDLAVEVDRRAQSPIIIGEAARQLGYRLVALADEAASAGRAPLSERDAHVILAEAMDVSKALIAAFDDGRIDALERKQLGSELRELIRAAQKMLDRLGED
jgi:hypothetical protein